MNKKKKRINYKQPVPLRGFLYILYNYPPPRALRAGVRVCPGALFSAVFVRKRHFPLLTSEANVSNEVGKIHFICKRLRCLVRFSPRPFFVME